MRKTIMILAILVCICATDAFGQARGLGRTNNQNTRESESVDGVTWYYKREVVQDDGSQQCRTNAIIAAAGDEKYMGDLSIPSSLGGCLVTEIGSSAFSRSAALTSVVIPEGVTRIGESAFANCELLTAVTMPATMKTIDRKAFYSCGALTAIAIPSAVTRIGQEAFSKCGSLANVQMFEGLACIDVRAFEECRALTSMTVSATIIGYSAFAGCSSLTNVVITENVDKIEGYAFGCCRSLTNVVISEGVKEIDGRAFNSCESLTRFDVPSTVTLLGSTILQGCYALTKLTVGEGNKNYKCINNCIVSANGKTLVAVPIGCAHVSIPDGVREIPEYMFSGDKQLSDIALPNSIIHIGKGAFYACHSLTNITIPASVKSVGANVSEGCRSLRSVRFLGEKPIGVEKSGLPSEEELKKREEEWQKKLQSADTEKREASERERVDAELKLWLSWPTQCSDGLKQACIAEFKTVLYDENNGGGYWTNGCGLCCIDITSPFWKKYDERGALRKIDRQESFSEYHWMTNYTARKTVERQTEWAVGHGMTFEEAKQKRDAFLLQFSQRSRAASGRSGNRPNLVGGGRGIGSLRERRMERERQKAAAAKAAAEEKAKAEAEAKAREAQREVERAAEKAERDRERAEQMAQLLKIQEELKRAREEKAKSGD